MEKIFVTKEQYEQVRHLEKETGLKIKDNTMVVADCINGRCGIYRVHRCYRTIADSYIAEVELVVPTRDLAEARLEFIAYKTWQQNL